MQFNPGDILLEKLTLVNYRGDEFDIMNSYSSIEIFEDILDSTISAKVVVLDTADIHQNFPVIGQERVLLTYRTSSDHKQVVLELHTFDVPVLQNINKHVNGFCLELMTIDGIRARTKFSLIPLDGNVGESIQDVMKNVIGSSRKIEADKITNSITYIPPRQKPFEIINTLCNRAVSEISNDVCDVLFYDTVDGYKMKSLTGLMRQVPSFRYRIQELNKLSSKPSSADEFYTIGQYTTSQAGSSIGKVLGGSFGGTVGVFDVLKRAYKETKFNIKDDKNKFEFINNDIGVDLDSEIVKDATDANFKYVLSGTKDHSLLLRTAKLDQVFTGNRIVADMAGNSDLRVGQTITVSIPSATVQDESLLKDNRFTSGKYLIISLRHVIGPDANSSYRTVVEMVKDSNKITLEDSQQLYERLS